MPVLPAGASADGLVGRTREMGILRDALAAGPPARGVTVVGDPGIGKSRLLAEFLAEAERAGRVVLVGRAAEFESHVPFGVFVNALDDHIAELDPQRLAQLGAWQLSLLGAVFPSLPVDASSDLIDAERYRMHRAVRSLLELLAEPAGLVLALDDVHWADEGSVELLDHLLRHPPRARLMLALACRPRQTSSRLWHTLSQAASDGVAELIELAPLTSAEATGLMPGDWAGTRRDEMYRASAGNPFYLEALVRAGDGRVPGAGTGPRPDGEIPLEVRAALAAELAALTPEQRTVAHAAALVADEFDPGLLAETAQLDAAAVVGALDHLAERDLLRPAGPAGRFRYRHPLVRSVAYQDAGAAWRFDAHGRAAVALRSRRAPAVDLAHHVERSALRGDADALRVLTEAAVATMQTTPATAAHFLRAAQALLPNDASATPQRLRLLGMLSRVLVVTGELHQSRDALHELLRLLPPNLTEQRAQAVRFCASVERLLGRHTEARAMVRNEIRNLADSDPRSAAVLTAGLASGEFMALERDPQRDWIAEAIAAARRSGDLLLLASGLAMSALAGPGADAAAPDGAASRGGAAPDGAAPDGAAPDGAASRGEAMRRSLDEAAALIDALPDGEVMRHLEASLWLGWGEIYADRLEAAARHLARGVRLARASGQTYLIGLLNSLRGMVYALTGELAAAAACFEDALETALLIGSSELRILALALSCWVATWRGELSDAVRMGKESVATAHGARNWQYGVAETMLGPALLYSGDPQACTAMLLDAGGGTELPDIMDLQRPIMYQLLTEAATAVGQVTQANEWADRAEAAAATLGLTQRTGYAQLARATADLPVDPARAAISALAAAESFGRVGVAVEAGRAHLLAALALGADGATAQAREQFRAARTRFEKSDAQLLLQHLLREERRMNARSPRAGSPGRATAGRAAAGRATAGRATAGPGDLAERYGFTRRELEMAGLVAEGLTNVDIGRRLHLSPRTVEAHLSHVYAKAEISGRAALAALWVAEAGPADRPGDPTQR